MNQSAPVKFSSKVLEKTIKTSIKKAIASKGINTTTRQGNKELKFLIGKIAQHSFDSLEQASNVGEKLGEKIVEISQKQGKQNLDGGVIRQLSHQKELYSLIGLPLEQSQAIEQSYSENDLASVSTVQVIEETDTSEQPINEETPSEETVDTLEQPINEETPAEETADTSEQPSSEETPSEETVDTSEQPSNEETLVEETADTSEQPINEETTSEEIVDTLEQPISEETTSEEIADISEQPISEETTSEEIVDTLEQPSSEETPSEAIEETPEQPSNEETSSEAEDAPENPEPNEESLIHS